MYMLYEWGPVCKAQKSMVQTFLSGERPVIIAFVFPTNISRYLFDNCQKCKVPLCSTHDRALPSFLLN